MIYNIYDAFAMYLYFHEAFVGLVNFMYVASNVDTVGAESSLWEIVLTRGGGLESDSLLAPPWDPNVRQSGVMEGSCLFCSNIV